MNTIQINPESQFFDDMTDESKVINFNGSTMPLGYYNLIVTIRDVSMYSKVGMKPHRYWSIGDVKKYFGIKGSAESMLEQLKAYKEIIAAQ